MYKITYRFLCSSVVLPVPCDLHHLVLNVFSKTLLQRLGNHGDLISAKHTQTQLCEALKPLQTSLKP